ncbi:rRNA maturation RNase YbeY [Patescibacteria group bacterium]|nr:rRNA maturation RNase YbeY [Patescibacteria group bacterium]MBU1970706.1 rRNA maturation RNase YbeY [Patescibacteria group bacterium]
MHVGISLVGNSAIRALNKKYLGRDCATDVLAFNYVDVKAKTPDEIKTKNKAYLGDIVVSVDRAAKQAAAYGNTFEQEVAELVAHGMLHLLGVHHEGDNDETCGRAGKSRQKIRT